MEHNNTPLAQIPALAVDAAVRLGHRLGITRVDPVILHESEHISIRLFPLDIVARAVVFADAKTKNRLDRELDIARHLIDNSAPIVGPSTELPAGPHIQQGFGLTLWDFVEHRPANDDNVEHLALAAEALHRVHRALNGYRGELPNFLPRIDRCRSLLENEAALPALGAADRAFLLMLFNRLRAFVTTQPANFAPIHGDAHLGNVFITSEGARWNDLDDVCIGPREWDIGWVPEAHLAAFEPVNRDLLAALNYLRSLCASVWCWDMYDLPEKREAAEYHLEYLKESCPFGR